MAPILSEEEYSCIVGKTLNTSDFTLLEIKEKPLSEEEVGILGEHYRAEATVQLKSSPELKLCYFVKIKPRNQGMHRDLVNNAKVFEKESRFYNVLFHDLKKKYLEVQEIRKPNASFWFCNCYLSREDVIILEDLSESGFKVKNSRTPLDYKHCALVLIALARLHAVSIAYEEKELANTALNLKELYPDMFFESMCVKQKGHLGYELFHTLQKGVLSLCEYMPNFGRNHKHYEFIQENLIETLDQLFELVKPSNKFRNVVCHGDLWANNIMFKYGPSGEPEELRLIDLQLIRYCPPGHDIMIFLHLTTTRKFRQTHLEELLNLYYTTFSAELELHQLQAQNLLPWTELQESCAKYSTLGLIFAPMYFQNILLNVDKIKDISDSEKTKQIHFQDKTDFLANSFKSDSLYRERICEATEEFIERCVLNEIDSH